MANFWDSLERQILGDTPLEFGDTGSSLVDSASYDPDTRNLTVTLRAGKVSKTYTYGGFPPSSWVEFYQAESKGQFFSRVIRPMFSGTVQSIGELQAQLQILMHRRMLHSIGVAIGMDGEDYDHPDLIKH